MDLMTKLDILADAAKYDVACTSSGASRQAKRGQLGHATQAGCCHSFTPDGRCIGLLKVLMTNVCVYDCAYCVSRRSNEVPRAMFTPRELAELTIEFYRRNYIEGLFLSSGVVRTPDYTTELMIRTLGLLRNEHGFRGYIHAKAVPGTSPELIDALGRLDEDGVEARRALEQVVLLEVYQRGAAQALLFGVADGVVCVAVGAQLDLHKRDHLADFGDDVDLAAAHGVVAGKDAGALLFDKELFRDVLADAAHLARVHASMP